MVHGDILFSRAHPESIRLALLFAIPALNGNTACNFVCSIFFSSNPSLVKPTRRTHEETRRRPPDIFELRNFNRPLHARPEGLVNPDAAPKFVAKGVCWNAVPPSRIFMDGLCFRTTVSDPLLAYTHCALRLTLAGLDRRSAIALYGGAPLPFPSPGCRAALLGTAVGEVVEGGINIRVGGCLVTSGLRALFHSNLRHAVKAVAAV